MVTTTPFEFADNFGFVQNAFPKVCIEEVSFADPLITHKRVQIQLNADLGSDEIGTVSLSPLGALALVSRLLQVLDEARKVQGLEFPQLHSSFLRDYRDAIFDGEPLRAEYEDLVSFYDTASRWEERAESLVSDDTSGMLLASILPPAIV